MQLFCLSLLNLAKICIRPSIYHGNKSRPDPGQNFKNCRFHVNFTQRLYIFCQVSNSQAMSCHFNRKDCTKSGWQIIIAFTVDSFSLKLGS